MLTPSLLRGRLNGNDVTTQIEFGKYEKLLFLITKNYSSLYDTHRDTCHTKWDPNFQVFGQLVILYVSCRQGGFWSWMVVSSGKGCWEWVEEGRND